VTDWTGEGPLVRLHVGLEDPDDLIEDLARGLALYPAA
jgi:cystathionine beta-lyase